MTELGKGGFATVFEVENVQTHDEYACKVTNQSQLQKKKHIEKFQAEMNIHKQLRDENICKCEMVFNDANNYYMLLELCNAGSLSQMTKKKDLTDEEI